MARHLALGFVMLASIASLVIFFVNSQSGDWIFAFLVMAFPIALVVLAVSQNGKLGSLRIPLLLLCIMLECGALGVLFLNNSIVDGPFGLPVSLYFLLICVWCGPLLVTTVTYAITFSEHVVNEETLQRLDQYNHRLHTEKSRQP